MSQAMVRQAKETEGTLALKAATLLAPLPMLILMWQALTRVGSEQTCFLAFLSSFDIHIFAPVVPTPVVRVRQQVFKFKAGYDSFGYSGPRLGSRQFSSGSGIPI